MLIRVVRPAELDSAAIDSWRSMQSSSSSFANPFLSPEFAIVVGEIRPNTRVAVLRKDRPSSDSSHSNGIGLARAYLSPRG